MAAIGMKWACFAPISAETSGSAITYGTGSHIDDAISASITFNRTNAKLYADDVVCEQDNSLTGYEIKFNAADLTDAVKASLLGETAATGTSGGPQTVSGDSAPYVGFGFVRVLRVNGATKAEGFWFYKAQFSLDDMNANTKGESIEWGTPTITGSGVGTYQDTSGKATFYEHQRFDTEAGAIAYVKGKAGIT